ncbi:M4 family metallopeptidase [Nocardioides donggukensis]|uniref:Neutral metalloproteinase n=1 Tax=Nocardioides donggukensis TaxID=2774019 RepID=A0A927K263_9ACTN|nr:M4 family metallopeptidase [Nocardioides donggukensis]MBD8868357.1 M4 family metallopeptidase [Nocardioides donggukensis]
MERCSFVPPYLLSRIAASREVAAASRCHRTLALDAAFRVNREAHLTAPRTQASARGADPEAPLRWRVHTADGGSALPGRPIRDQDQPALGDPAADEAWEGVRASLALFAEVYGHRSYDGLGASVSATVHYERDYANAFWDGANLVFGDGDGQVFGRFTRPVDVLGHELTHAVTEHTAGLVYRGQSGALNESVSDVFASCLKQRLLGQDAVDGDWLIGAELFLPRIRARGLRSMSAPGTAYDDPLLGRDPQPDHMSGYVVTDDDNGGVHLNSGIPNRAFHLAATGIGGTSAHGAGAIWWQALGTVRPSADFATFAAATVAAAGEHAGTVEEAWREVGVHPGPGPDVPEADPDRSQPEPAQVEVRRSGGLLGRTVTGHVDLGGSDPRAGEVRELIDRVDPESVPTGSPHPDGYVYVVSTQRWTVQLVESDLTGDLRRLVDLLLDDRV